MAERLGAFIRQKRHELKMSRIELARNTNGRLSHTTIANLEKGVDPRTGKPRQPRAETLRLLAPALGCSYEDLAELAGYISREEKQAYVVQEAAVDGKRLSPQELAVIRALREAGRKGARNN